MKKLKFHYRMKLSFDSMVREHRFTLKCIPTDTERQKISNLVIDIYPNEFISRGYDSFHNACIYGYAKGEHNKFYIDVQGWAETGLCESEPAQAIHRAGYFKYQTAYTEPGGALRAFRDSIPLDDKMSNMEKALEFMKRLHGEFAYVQGVTGIQTTAEEAMRLKKGVCQDYSHIMLSLCRMEQIPCRYTVGMLKGEGLSHAWIDLYQDGRWMALDPTNNLVVDDEHIKISGGRDYRDCNINQGVFCGNARQVQEASVVVDEIIIDK